MGNSVRGYIILWFQRCVNWIFSLCGSLVMWCDVMSQTVIWFLTFWGHLFCAGIVKSQHLWGSFHRLCWLCRSYKALLSLSSHQEFSFWCCLACQYLLSPILWKKISPTRDYIILLEILVHCNIDFSSSDLLLNGQVSIQRLQDNNDKMYKRTIIFFSFSGYRVCLILNCFWWWVFLLLNNICREEEECEDTKQKPHDRSLRTYLSNGDIDACTRSDSSEVRFHSLCQGIILACSYIPVYNIILLNTFSLKIWGKREGRVCLVCV